ncbi:MAG: nucleotidyl transferase AbiEii/AbiGii toxin family protein [Myxococcota bacterium]|nr:nucleotidyl transferase AbiEii/AbiGii toxin family protein [Myxococcota bacterium]
MHTEVLTADQLAVLEALKRLDGPRGFYLAGGTALALRHGHRRSVDFDFFRPDPFDGRLLVAEVDGAVEHMKLLPSGPETVYVRLRGVTTSFFRYRYPLLEPAEPTPWGFGLASDRDIAAMKLEAVAGRGARRDFVDLRILCLRGLRLEDAFEAFDRKYGASRTDHYHRLRALAYFEDAESEPMPDMTAPFDWEEAKRFFAGEAARLLRRGIACGDASSPDRGTRDRRPTGGSRHGHPGKGRPRRSRGAR